MRSASSAFPDVPGEEAAQSYDFMQSVRETLRRADEALKKANQPVCPRPVCVLAPASSLHAPKRAPAGRGVRLSGGRAAAARQCHQMYS